MITIERLTELVNAAAEGGTHRLESASDEEHALVSALEKMVICVVAESERDHSYD